jgi:hypothetical protein
VGSTAAVEFLANDSLNENWVTNLIDARTKIEIWRRDYNEERPVLATNPVRTRSVWRNSRQATRR